MISQLVGLFAYGLVSVSESAALDDLIVQLLNPVFEFWLNLGL